MSNQKKMYLTKRNNGYYYVGYFENGKLHWKTTRETKKAEAIQFLKTFIPAGEE